MPSDQDQSHMALGDNQGKSTEGGRDSSDSESSDNAMDTTPDSLQDRLPSLESQPSSLPANSIVAPAEDAQVNQTEGSGATEQANTEEESEVAAKIPTEKKSNAHKSSDNQPPKTATVDTPAQCPPSKDNKSATSQPAQSKGTETTTTKDPKEKNPKNKKDADNPKQSKQDQNANVEANTKQAKENKQKGKNQQDQKQAVAPEQQKVFGPKVMLANTIYMKMIAVDGPQSRNLDIYSSNIFNATG